MGQEGGGEQRVGDTFVTRHGKVGNHSLRYPVLALSPRESCLVCRQSTCSWPCQPRCTTSSFGRNQSRKTSSSTYCGLQSQSTRYRRTRPCSDIQTGLLCSPSPFSSPFLSAFGSQSRHNNPHKLSLCVANALDKHRYASVAYRRRSGPIKCASLPVCSTCKSSHLASLSHGILLFCSSTLGCWSRDRHPSTFWTC